MAPRPVHDELLLGGRWLPLTRSIIFVDQEAEEFVETWMAWRGAVIMRDTGCVPVVSRIGGTLEDALAAMLPLATAVPSKCLVMPTANGWSAFVENDWMGTEVQLTPWALAANGLRTVAVSEAPHTYSARTDRGWWGERKVTAYVPSLEHPDEPDGGTVGVRTTESGRWEVAVPPTPLPFPDPTDHTARRIRDRFTHGHLLEVAEWFGLRPTDPGFYTPGGEAFLIERTDPRDPSWHELTLEQAYGIDRPVFP
ncbi:hypothetical protein J1G42_01725 [Cellulomonas sp. zg-ZUI222]|uniref:Uncharacterized protein n=1 Tax=Cellulomonas wangleii TaxID=2816956 RepID=A0ABX8D4D3_9CELL|nr:MULTISPECIES: hypothetical protein [Cellulomonas]MBO0898678.1 hypothetical protein [Cellulomonas sp. zg-ZUI22]MBO0919541.1 hypothetical protein [Cellulomonas wangleii]MBO0924317.1 hypothetical protein [Cellulomonas wangleii]QVI62323.1 hypothetical protein KG103_18285 [Cellulomonas wangleii]